MTPTADKRDAILEAALVLFDERGFHGAAVPELAARAGVAAGTIYRYFDSKEAIVNALFQSWKLRLTEAVVPALAMEQPWRGRFRALWTTLAAFSVAHPRVLQFLELHHHADYLDATSRAIEANTAEALFALVAAGQAEEALVELEPPALIALVYGAFVGLLRAERLGYLTLSPDVIARTEERVWALVRR